MKCTLKNAPKRKEEKQNEKTGIKANATAVLTLEKGFVVGVEIGRERVEECQTNEEGGSKRDPNISAFFSFRYLS